MDLLISSILNINNNNNNNNNTWNDSSDEYTNSIAKADNAGLWKCQVSELIVAGSTGALFIPRHLLCKVVINMQLVWRSFTAQIPTQPPQQMFIVAISHPHPLVTQYEGYGFES